VNRPNVQLPQGFREFGRWQREGEAGARWLAALPDLVADQCLRWNLHIDGEAMHGDNAIAVPVRRDGEPLVLKVGWPDHVAEQATALRDWDGQGTVSLIDVDTDAGALLLERLDHRHTLNDLPREHPAGFTEDPARCEHIVEALL
jgi:streptomycin 6-kinase